MNTLTAAELYEAVWLLSLKELSEQWQVHSHALGQLIDAHQIPRPENGHWTKKALGKPLNIVPFPESISPTRLIDLTPLKSSKQEKAKARRNLLPVPKKSMRSYSLLNGIKGSLKEPSFEYEYHLVQDFMNKDILRVDVSSEQKERAINILHFLLAEFERRCWPVSVEEARYDRKLHNTVTVDGEAIRFRLREKLKQVRRELTAKDLEDKKRNGWIYHEKINVPSGELHLTIETHFGGGVTKVFKDKSNLSLEEQLGNFVISLVEAAKRLKELQAERDREEEVRRHQTSIRQQFESVVAEQTQNVNAFLGMFEKWQYAEKCRAFIDAIQASEAFAKIDALDRERWLAWAHNIADKVDPIKTFSTPNLLCERNGIFHTVLARSINESTLALDEYVPSISLNEVESALEELASQSNN